MLTEYYYCLIFIVLAIFQEQVEGFVVSITCSILAVFSESLINHLMTLGFEQYLASSALDVALIFIGLSLITSKIGFILAMTCTLSFGLNIFYHVTVTTSYQAYPLIFPLYSTLNIILFEVLMYACLIHSKVFPYLISKFPNALGFLEKFTPKQEKQ